MRQFDRSESEYESSLKQKRLLRNVPMIPGGSSLDYAKQIIEENKQEDAFYIFKKSEVYRKIKLWREHLSRIKIYYAMKCNNNHHLLKFLVSHNVGFDCASKGEIKKALSLGTNPDKIVYANPNKQISHLEFAKNNGVRLMTFDSESELYKAKEHAPNARLLIRINFNAKDVLDSFGDKFGVKEEDFLPLVKEAKKLNVNIVGISFHLGSGCKDAENFYRAICKAGEKFEVLRALGFSPNVLDIGGGFPKDMDANIQYFTHFINSALDENFPESSEVEILAEPGRYIPSSAFTLATQVISKKEIVKENIVRSVVYFLNDGFHGSFGTINTFPIDLPSAAITKDEKERETFPSTLYGPSCAPNDIIMKNVPIPYLEIGDWLIWDNMGAYTLSLARTFNGFKKAAVYQVE